MSKKQKRNLIRILASLFLLIAISFIPIENEILRFVLYMIPYLIVGYDKADDASVYVVSEDTAVVNTVDFFPPVCDDPYLYGQIAREEAGSNGFG